MSTHNMNSPVASFLPTKSTCRVRHFSGRRRSLGAMLARASWGADVQFNDAKLIETGTIAENLQRLYVDIGSSSSGYTTPGQFIQAKVGEDSKPGFFAIASPPDASSNVVELLIKKQGGTAELLCALKEGSTIQVSSVMGKGFQVDKAPSNKFKNLYLFATGSGISPIKALIESDALTPQEREHVKLYFGVRNPGQMAYSDRLKVWENDHGVVVIPVYSEQGKGYVQDIFMNDHGAVVGPSTAAVLCGQKGMAEAVTEALKSGGVDANAILLNF